ncbi:MAG: dicarboxylate/amino acid:cation symporter [Planctomycetota bacterium]|jgi:Na+/H+-dicarboxylate symporter|nr:dicarboxylate/amino acid:cation symporter [Planctomycetota bacterium]
MHTKIGLAMLLGILGGWLLQEASSANYITQTVTKAGHPVTLEVLDPTSQRGMWLAPFQMAANIFMSLLKMLIVPLVLSSIVTGVAGISGGKEFGRLGVKTLGYYMTTSFFAIITGLLVVNLTRPGIGASLNLPMPDSFAPGEGTSFIDILLRMVPQNVFSALSDNGSMLQIIVFALLLGYFIGKTPEPHGPRIRSVFESFFEVMMSLASGILKLIPYGVFALVVKVVGETGFATFKPLLFYMGIVAAALLIHACIVLPLLLRFVGGISPLAWFKAMSPALMTAFSTSSSSITLPVTIDCTEQRGGVSNKHSSFVLPLGATVNMDGTALYECVGVIFLSQYYASTGDFDLTIAKQVFIVLTALLASIGAAGIPSAGLIMMTAILSALGLPIEGAMLLLAIDRPLDMLRTLVNVWSDSCGAALVAKSEGDAILEGHE